MKIIANFASRTNKFIRNEKSTLFDGGTYRQLRI